MWFSGHLACRRQWGQWRGKRCSGKGGSSCCGGSGREMLALDDPGGCECTQRMIQTAGRHPKQAANATKEQVSQRQEFVLWVWQLAQIPLNRIS